MTGSPSTCLWTKQPEIPPLTPTPPPHISPLPAGGPLGRSPWQDAPQEAAGCHFSAPLPVSYSPTTTVGYYPAMGLGLRPGTDE